MTAEQEKLVIDHVKNDGLIMIRIGYFYGFAKVEESGNGGWTIRSDFIATQPLREMPFGRLSFYKRVEPE